MKPAKLPTITMSPMPKFGYYDPVSLILGGEKAQTLRKHRCHGRKEITVRIAGKQQRTGIIVEFTKHEQVSQKEFLTSKFAIADGFRNSNWVSDSPQWLRSPLENLQAFLAHFYGEVPETIWCNYFRVVQRPEEAPK